MREMHFEHFGHFVESRTSQLEPLFLNGHIYEASPDIPYGATEVLLALDPGTYEWIAPILVASGYFTQIS